MVPNADTTRKELTDNFVSILELVVPQKLETLEWLEESAPVFMSPPVFSRMDLPVVSGKFKILFSKNSSLLTLTY